MRLLILFTLLNFSLFAQDNMYPLDAYLVKPTEKLQSKLDQYGTVRLQTKTYTEKITLRSNQEIYGLPGSKINAVIVEPGTKNAILSGVKMEWMKFPKGDLITEQNLFYNLNARFFKIEDGRLRNNKFVYLFGKIIAETGGTGFMRDNKFIRVTVHSAYPQLKMIGNDSYDSYGNVFLWFNFLTSHQENAYIRKQKSLTIAGIDFEDYSNGYKLFDVKETDNFTVISAGGGDNKKDSVPLIDIDAKKSILYGLNIHSRDDSENIIVGPNTQSIALVNSNDYKMQFQGKTGYADIFKSSDGVNYSEPGNIEDAMSFPTGQPWQYKKHSTTIKDRKPDIDIRDHTDYLQNRLNNEKEVYLNEGIYYISRSLVMGPGNILIGSGKGKTIIRATRDINIIVNKQRTISGELITRTKFQIGYLSLENGKNGIYYTVDDDTKLNGRRDQVLMTDAMISGVEFYNMSYAGIHLDYSNCMSATLDNNIIDHLDFISCKYGVKQSTVCDCPAWPCPYTDKTVFYRCRFIGNETAVDLTAKRQNNNNGFIECLFKDSKKADLILQSNAYPLIAMCEFESPQADQIISLAFRPLIIYTTINSKKSGAEIFGANCFVHDSRVTANNGKLFQTGKWPHVVTNTEFSGINVSGINYGIFYNSSFADNPKYSKKLIEFKDGNSRVVIDKPSEPKPGILITNAEYQEPIPEPAPEPTPDPCDTVFVEKTDTVLIQKVDTVQITLTDTITNADTIYIKPDTIPENTVIVNHPTANNGEKKLNWMFGLLIYVTAIITFLVVPPLIIEIINRRS